jgi:4-hydroxy-2-oxoheptanedioate aldolase
VENPVKQKIAAGRPAYGAIVTAASAPMVQVMAAAGLDWVMLDLEHGMIDAAAVHAMIAATAGTRCAPLARIPHDRHDLAEIVLDAGAYGLVFPMVCSKAEAEAAVAALRYPPHGRRGWGPFYAAARWGLAGPDYFRVANDTLLNVVLIEHADGVRNLDAILAVKGLDVVVIAPGDLSVNLGYPNQRTHPEVLKVVAEIEAKVLRSGVALGGIALAPGEAADKAARGYRMIFIGADVTLMQRAIAASLDGVAR